MKQNRPYPFVLISPKGERSVLTGHPWIYDQEVKLPFDEEGSDGDQLPASGSSAKTLQKTPWAYPKDGELVDAFSMRGSYLGTGFYNSHSKIRVRLISRNANDRFDEAFYERRLRYAWEYRKSVLPPKDLACCRIIFGEADQFPGLTVDRFGNILVTQTLSLGIEKLKPLLFPLLVKILREDGHQIDAVYERNDASIRSLEGLEQNRGFFLKETSALPDRVQISENGVRYFVDYQEGQKTGFFLDQKYNRKAAATIARGKRVLDCFTDTGSFALNCALAGAAHVHAVDISAPSIEVAKENARLNGLTITDGPLSAGDASRRAASGGGSISFEVANVFDLLPQLEKSAKRQYDMIILDPPAFTKSRKTIASAERGYKEINYRAMKILPRGGYLATCSCSHFMSNDLFRKMLWSAAADAGVQLRQIEERQQAPDHPILWNVPETNYLKFYLFQIV
ncbi:MAG: class I SAM-dependent rRNA methyltransferase [Firmicutes bacterium]|nr:class I SAM-dependent rRNA methyltransferase [Bacillota bacterium]